MNTTELPVTRIQPSGGWVDLGLADLWRHRELIAFLAMREIQVRYKQTLLGIAWIALHPVATALVLTIVLGVMVRVPSNDAPYAVFVLCGIVAWNFFNSAFNRGSTSLVSSAHLISKVYFPRLVIPIATVLAPLVDLGIGMLVLIGVGLYYHIVPGPQIVGVVPFVLLALAAALGVALWLSALNVRFRDITHMLPIVTTIGLYVTPVIYPSSLIPSRWRQWIGLNPMSSVVEGFRWAFLGQSPPEARMVLLSVLVTVALLVSGGYAFRRMERTFADIV